MTDCKLTHSRQSASSNLVKVKEDKSLCTASQEIKSNQQKFQESDTVNKFAIVATKHLDNGVVKISRSWRNCGAFGVSRANTASVGVTCTRKRKCSTLLDKCHLHRTAECGSSVRSISHQRNSPRASASRHVSRKGCSWVEE